MRSNKKRQFSELQLSWLDTFEKKRKTDEYMDIYITQPNGLRKRLKWSDLPPMEKYIPSDEVIMSYHRKVIKENK